MWKVEVDHYKPCYINGDLSSESVNVNCEVFKLKKSALDYIKSEVKSYKSAVTHTQPYYYVSCFTGKKWIEENTGEEREEVYRYKLIKFSITDKS